MTDEIVTQVHDVVKASCKKQGYLKCPSWHDTQLILHAVFLIYGAIKKGEK